jgi:steroid delta-isomerase-like uncharacterized protein
MPNHTDTVLHRWFEQVWNQGREDAIDELMTQDSLVHGLEVQIQGPAAFKPFWRKFKAAFPDMRITVEQCLIDGDMMAVRCSVTGSHTGDGLPVPASGNKAAFTGMCMARIRDGKIAEGWNNFDFMSMYQQLGLTLN